MALNRKQSASPVSSSEAEFAEACGDLLGGRENLAATRGIAQEHMEQFYRFCYERYVNGDYDTASRGFQLLCLYDHQNPRNWQGYGYSLLGLKDYDKAATSLAFGSLFLSEHSKAWAEARLHVVRSLLSAGREDVAGAALRELLETASDPGVLSQAHALSEALSARVADAGQTGRRSAPDATTEEY